MRDIVSPVSEVNCSSTLIVDHFEILFTELGGTRDLLRSRSSSCTHLGLCLNHIATILSHISFRGDLLPPDLMLLIGLS